MSHSSLHEPTDAAAVAPDFGDANPDREDDFTPAMKDALVARAKDIIAGRVAPPLVITPPQVERFLQREYADCQPPPTAEAIRDITEHLCLQAYYKGQPVACFMKPGGGLAVVAAGEHEIKVLLRELSASERPKVVVMDTE